MLSHRNWKHFKVQGSTEHSVNSKWMWTQRYVNSSHPCEHWMPKKLRREHWMPNKLKLRQLTLKTESTQSHSKEHRTPIELKEHETPSELKFMAVNTAMNGCRPADRKPQDFLWQRWTECPPSHFASGSTERTRFLDSWKTTKCCCRHFPRHHTLHKTQLIDMTITFTTLWAHRYDNHILHKTWAHRHDHHILYKIYSS